MSDQNIKGKSKYESPILVPLGEMAKGTGALCEAGSSADVYCKAGGTAVSGSPGYCQAGTVAHPGYCTAGTDASTACTTVGAAAASAACTGGTTAGGTCTGGTTPV